MKRGGEPTGFTISDNVGPKDECVTLVPFSGKTRKLRFQGHGEMIQGRGIVKHWRISQNPSSYARLLYHPAKAGMPRKVASALPPMIPLSEPSMHFP